MNFPRGARRAAILLATALLASTATTTTASASLPATDTTVTAAPNPVLLGGTVNYAIQVTETQIAGCGGCGAAIGGTVSLTSDGTPIAGCQAATVTQGAAACSAVAPAPRGGHTIQATYSGDSDYAGSTGVTNLRVVAPTVVTPVADPNPVARRAAVTYRVTISPTPYIVSSIGHSETYSTGTAAFSVDGTAVAGCGSVTISQSGLASCVSTAPPVSGTHSLDVSYTGSTFNTAASGHAAFEVAAPALSVPAAGFGRVTAGSTAARTVTVTNDDAQAVAPGSATLAGPGFAIVADGCAEATLAPGASCDVQLRFSPAAAGAYAGTLSLTDDAGASHGAALSGTGVAVPGPAPVAPKGGVFAPGAKTTLTVTTTTPSSGGTPTTTVAVPLSCPASETCDLDGTVTIETSAFAKAAHASAASTTTVARFSKVHIAAGKVKTIKLELSRAFIKRAQKAGIRRIRAMLTINTVLGSGRRITTHQRVTVLLPKAAKKQAAPKLRPRFTG